MNKNQISKLSTKEKLDIIGKVVDQLVRTTDACFNLSGSEKDIIVECAFDGIHKIMNDRYNRIRGKYRTREI